MLPVFRHTSTIRRPCPRIKNESSRCTNASPGSTVKITGFHFGAQPDLPCFGQHPNRTSFRFHDDGSRRAHDQFEERSHAFLASSSSPIMNSFSSDKSSHSPLQYCLDAVERFFNLDAASFHAGKGFGDKERLSQKVSQSTSPIDDDLVFGRKFVHPQHRNQIANSS